MQRLVRVRWMRMVMAALSAAGAVASVASPPIPISDFVWAGQFNAPVLSPDGKHLIVTQLGQQDGRDASLLVVYELAEMKIVGTMRMPKGRVAAGYRWVSDRRLVVSVGREYGSLNIPRFTGELFAMNLDGSAYEYLYGFAGRPRAHGPTDAGYGSIAAVSAKLDGRLFVNETPWHITSSFSRLYEIDSADASRRTIAEIRRPGFGFLVDTTGQPRFAFGAEVDTNFAVYRYDEVKREWEPFAVQAQGDLSPLFISPDNTQLFGTFSVGGGPRKLVRQAVTGGDQSVLAEDVVGNIDLIQRGPERAGPPIAAGTSVGLPKLRYLDEQDPAAQLHKRLSAEFPGSLVRFNSFSKDGSKLIFSVASDRDEGAYYFFDRTAGKAALLFARRPWIDPERMAERRPIRFKARDGLELHGYLTLPVDRSDAKLPLILLPHGGPHGIADDWFFDTDAQFLASRGYAVLQVNYRGSGGRGKQFESLGYRQWGGRVQDDLIDGVRWIVEQGTVDPGRVCVYGASFGAYSAMMSTIREPAMFKCAVGYAGLYDLPMVYDEYDAKADLQTYNYWVKVIGRDAAELVANSPSRQADKLKIPVLLVHGSNDGVTPKAQAEAMRDGLTKAGRAPEWLYVEDEGHGFYAAKNRQAFYEKLEAFLAKHIGN